MAERVDSNVLGKVVMRAQLEELPALVGILFLEAVKRGVAGRVGALGGSASNRITGLHPGLDVDTVARCADRGLRISRSDEEHRGESSDEGGLHTETVRRRVWGRCLLEWREF